LSYFDEVGEEKVEGDKDESKNEAVGFGRNQ
jgi:hypothetical protein